VEECDSSQRVGQELRAVRDETRELTFYEGGMETEAGAYDCRPRQESTELTRKIVTGRQSRSVNGDAKTQRADCSRSAMEANRLFRAGAFVDYKRKGAGRIWRG
jgi:hypothetical protein